MVSIQGFFKSNLLSVRSWLCHIPVCDLEALNLFLSCYVKSNNALYLIKLLGDKSGAQ